MLRFRSRTPRWVIVYLDMLINLFALLFAYIIRFDLDSQSELIKEEWLLLKDYLWIFILVKFVVFNLFKIHKGLVRYTSTHDLNRIFIAISTCTLIFAGFGSPLGTSWASKLNPSRRFGLQRRFRPPS